ncbi:TetR/AcrR family transcriptional regulator [Candidatus Poribacteria bacterium]|nr:TetR/AcrR family transcriptional regulator [Candidatus Poribacteria bacterium]
MKKSERKSIAKKRRAEILEAFHRCIMKYGLHKASNRKLAEEAGIQLSSLHHYFGNRNRIVEELIKHLIEEDIDRGKALGNQYGSSKERFDNMIRYLFDPSVLLGRHGGIFYDFWSEAFRNEKIRGTFRMEIESIREVITTHIRDSGIAPGISRVEIKELANVLIALHEGTEYLWNMDPENVSPKNSANLAKRFIEAYAKERGKRKKA